MPFKGQIAVHVKNVMQMKYLMGWRWRTVKKKSNEYGLVIWSCMTSFFPEQPLAKLSNSSLMPCDEWLTGGWLRSSNLLTVKLVLSKSWFSFGQSLGVAVSARASQGGLRLFLLSPGRAEGGVKPSNLTQKPRCHVQPSPEMTYLYNESLRFL